MLPARLTLFGGITDVPHGFLVATLPSTHPLFQSRLWVSGLLLRLQDKVLSGCGENKISQMIATGVSPTLVLANQLDCEWNDYNSCIAQGRTSVGVERRF